MLDGDKLVELIGHATVNSPLDDFLKENGIKARPKGNSGHYDIEDKSTGIYFQYYEYDNYSEKYFIPPKSKGVFIFQGAIFRNKVVAKGGSFFAGKYPFGATNKSTAEDILKTLGKPKKFKEGDEDSADTYHYFSGKTIFSFDFNYQTKVLECLQVEAANEYDRKHGLID